jgi:uncharacterized protein (DUF1330 family)
MKAHTVLALGVLAGIGIGAAAVEGLHAQAKPPVYVVNEIDVTDQAGFQAYAQANAKLIESHGGRYIIRGGKVTETISGTPPAGRYTIYVFDDEDKMKAWRNDPGFKDLMATRDKAGKFRSFVVEGIAK